jgi:hypothetical protein
MTAAGREKRARKVARLWASGLSVREAARRTGIHHQTALDDLSRLDIDRDDARKLASLLLEAAGDEDAAAAIPADMARRKALARQRQDASDNLRRAKVAAEEAFFGATAGQRATYNEAIDAAEHDYGETAGERVYRSVELSGASPGEELRRFTGADDPWPPAPEFCPSCGCLEPAGTMHDEEACADPSVKGATTRRRVPRHGQQ